MILFRSKKTVGLALAAMLATVPVFFMLGSEFMPPLQEGSILYMPTAIPGMSVSEAQRVLQIQDRILKGFPEVETVYGKAGRAGVKPGELLVNDDALIQGWELYVGHLGLSPETRSVGTALRVISAPERRQLRHGGRVLRYRVSDLQHLLAWAEEHGIGDPETLRGAVGDAQATTPPSRTTDDLASIPAAGRA